ncbi:MAG: hypothetical protein PHE72_11810 [candidate division Zixibacteria bacterium]|nr:PD40 domain-containing protein [candidate division Zixibacteria bacterium]MDD4918482.1 hypothetical protein [candidate division Zixibacteria bacterium]
MRNSRKMKWVWTAVLAAAAVGLWLPAQAQFYFGKNKVQYTRFDWQVMTTEHFRIYFYSEEEEIARIAAQLAEDSYRALAAKFNHEINEKTPLIIYSSPSYFSQTNVIPSLLPESVGGFTEFMKGRVVLPFHGSYYDFAHVLRHELVHVFQLSKMEAVLARMGRVNFGRPPLWFTEGLAEYWSKAWDAEAEMVVKDMAVNELQLGIEDLYRVAGSYYMYKLGESICTFIDSTYGPEKLTLLFENLAKGKTFDEVVKLTLGDDLREVSRKWRYSLKKCYYPQLEEAGLPDMESVQITRDGYSVRGVPIMWDAGDGRREWIVFKANRMGYSGIYMTPSGEGRGRRVKTLLKGERSSDFESLYLLRSGIDATDSGMVVFSSKSKGNDVIYVYNLREERVTHRYEFADLAGAHSPRLSPDGTQLVFAGVTLGGMADVYALNLADGAYRPILEDIYYDTDPVFSPDGNQIVFASDRGPEGKEGALNLFSYALGSGTVRQLTFGRYRDQTPDGAAGGIYFTSDRNGTFNIYRLDSLGGLTRQSTYVTGAFEPRVTPDGKGLVYSGYQKMGYQVFRMELPAEPAPVAQETPPPTPSWRPDRIDSKYVKSSVKYETDYSLDIAQSAVGYDPVYGSLGGFQFAMSDMLGNHSYHFLLTNTANTKDEFLQSFNIGVTYLNRERRLNWGIGAFHLYDEYFNDYDGFYWERQAGMIGVFSYPFSKFHRLDVTTVGRHSNREEGTRTRDRRAVLMTNYLSWVYDNSLWDISGPIDGRRYNLTVGLTTRLDGVRSFNRLAAADVRHYFRLGRVSAFANRLFAYWSEGTEPQRIYFGGSWSFRGFDRREWYTRHVLFASNELRFPLINVLSIGSPIGGIGFRAIRGAIFADVGSAWEEEFDQFYGSFGAGFRVALANLILLRFDFSRTTDFETISRNTEFDFFFGWNF